MSKQPKFLVISAGFADIVITSVESSRISSYTPAQRQKIPELLRQLSRYTVSTAEELAEERRNLIPEERKRGRPSRTAS